MLLFINLVTLVALEYYNFNTSHVTVYQQEQGEYDMEKHFNTSHVTVYLTS